MSDNQNQPVSSPRRHTLPAWVVAVLVLQSLTLIAVVASQPAAAPVQGQDIRVRPGEERQPPTLPNAADQRMQQIRLLEQIHRELVGVNRRLDRSNDLLRNERVQEPN